MARSAPQDEAFTRFVVESRGSLARAAWFLVGDTDLAADLVQETYVRTYVAWNRVRPEGALAYARTVLVNANTDRLRRRHGESSLAPETDVIDPRDATAGVDARDELARLLVGLPRRQRQVVVMRYAMDLPEQDVADTLGISVGAVKSTASRALAALRTRAGAQPREEYVR